MKVGFISLGCSKNLIDTEVAIGHFKNNNYEIETNPEKAEIIVINTCGFIESAKEEAINTILEMAEYKKRNCKYLIAMGCLVQRYYDDLVKELPEVDLFIKIDEYPQMWQKIEKLIKENIVEESTTKTNTKISEMKPLPMPTYNEFYERVITTGKNFAYLKIGEGCSNRCTYCAIPYIRGPFVSRRIEEIMEEARMLAGKGIRELIVIAQDTTKYGEDLYGEPKLAELLQQLSAIPEIKWIRFLYSYPEGINDELIEIVKNNEKIAKYFDIPIQHISNSILKRMNRKYTKEQYLALVEKMKARIPGIVLSTDIIVGFPGETEEDFEDTLDVVSKVHFEQVYMFIYSRRVGTPADKMENQVPDEVKHERFDRLKKLAESQIAGNNQKYVNTIQKVLVEGKSKTNENMLTGRTETNKVVNFEGTDDMIGKIVNLKIVSEHMWYLKGEVQ